MNRLLLCLSFFLLGIAVSPASAQNYPKTGADFISWQKKQEATVKAAQKKGTISDNEYEKLMTEQDKIKTFLAKSDMDEIWTAKEKNKAYDMLHAAEKRLSKYKRNGEIY